MSTQEPTSYVLSDDSLVAIAKALQVAMLTGTDIIDNLRQLRLTIEGDKLTPTQEYIESFNSGIERLMSEMEDTDEETNG